MKNLLNVAFVAIRKNVFPIITIVAITLFATACGGSSKMTKATSTRVDLASSVRIIPSIADLDVNPVRVTATAQAGELESLNTDQAKQNVVAKALATVNGDVMLAPRFVVEKGSDGKMTSITVTGYAAMVSSFRTITESDVTFNDSLFEQTHPAQIAFNTMTVADVEYSVKKSVSLSHAELTGKNETSALKLAKEKMLRQEKADVLFAEQYTLSVNEGALTAFTLTAFPGKYVNYRQTTLREQMALKPTSSPVVRYQAIAADIKPVAQRVQLKFGTGNTSGNESELKEMARSAALQMHNADLLLNETFYFDYQEKVITHVTICGTPAVYTNFHPLRDNEVVDVHFAPIAGDPETEQKPSFLNTLLNLFKKKK